MDLSLMSVPSSTNIPLEDESVIQRVGSDETSDSPFGSELTTPVDENAFYRQGIHERLDIAERMGDYFRTDEVQFGMMKSVVEADIKIESTVADNQPQIESLTLSPSDSMRLVASPAFSSSESVPNFRTGTIYNLPNEHILIERSSNVSKSAIEDSEDDIFEKDDEPASFPMTSKLHETQSSIMVSELRLLLKNLTIFKLVQLVIRILCFVPWCVAVGGALVLFPDHLEYLAFHTGYLASPVGIRRFAHWAEYGMQHVAIFAAFLGLFVFVFRTTGFLLIGGLLAQFYHVWNHFSLDRTVPLGTDDLQTIYLLATTHWLNGTSLDIKKVDNYYYLLGEFEIGRMREEKA